MLQIMLDLLQGETVPLLDLFICLICAYFAYVSKYYLMELEVEKAIQKLSKTIGTKVESV